MFHITIFAASQHNMKKGVRKEAYSWVESAVSSISCFKILHFRQRGSVCICVRACVCTRVHVHAY